MALQINKKLFVAAVIESGMTVVELCNEAASSHQTYKKLKNGQTVKFPSLRRFCAVLGLKPADLLEDDDKLLSEPNHEARAREHLEQVKEKAKADIATAEQFLKATREGRAMGEKDRLN